MQNVTGNLAAELSMESDPLSELLRKRVPEKLLPSAKPLLKAFFSMLP